MKKIITIALLLLSLTNFAQQNNCMVAQTPSISTKVYEEELIEDLHSSIEKQKSKRNLISEEKQKESVWFSDETSMREATISEIIINGETLIITVKFKPIKGRLEEQKVLQSLFITARSVKNYEDHYGFKLITSSGEYDEEIYILFEDNKMTQWFTTVLEVFSGKILEVRPE